MTKTSDIIGTCLVGVILFYFLGNSFFWYFYDWPMLTSNVGQVFSSIGLGGLILFLLVGLVTLPYYIYICQESANNNLSSDIEMAVFRV